MSDLIGEISAASARADARASARSATPSTQLDQVTQQNAALVEECAAAAESLKEQAAQLAQVVSVFRLGAGDQAGLAASATVHVTRPPAPKRPAPAPARPRTTALRSGAKPAPSAAASAAPAPAAEAVAMAAVAASDDWASF